MLESGILNPHVLELVARIRHTNTLVIADWAFPYWPEIETVDISLTFGIPMVMDVFDALKANFKIGKIIQATEFLDHNSPETVERFDRSFAQCRHAVVERMPHIDLKMRVPEAIGLIRTGDPTCYSNLIIESA